MISHEEINGLFADFLKTYETNVKDAIWLNLSKKFRDFWDKRILSEESKNLADDEIDEIIKILDRNAKGNTRKEEAVAKAMIAQGAWRRMFCEFKSNKDLAGVITKILQETDIDCKSEAINRLYAMNQGKQNYLTGQSGNAINCFLAAYDPMNNSSVISLSDRKKQIDYFGFPWTFNFDEASSGKRIVQTNKILSEGFHALGIKESARTISQFCYYPTVKPLWRGEYTIKRADKEISVTVPIEEKEGAQKDEIRESFQIQSLIAEIGSRMGMEIWLPRGDRSRVLKLWTPPEGKLIEKLPMNYEDATLKTIEQIDVLWLKGRAIIRAFEVEHTTSIYSGILRMADLLALQPNITIKLHIVAPSEKRDKVIQEINRPAFKFSERVSLTTVCTYISYESLRELSVNKHLGHMNDDVLDEYSEEAE